MVHVRVARYEELAQIVGIYNQAIPSKTSTGDTIIFKPEERTAWFRNHTVDKYPIYVSVHNDKLVGWLSLSPYRGKRAAFEQVAELSYYIDQAHHRQGIASKLLQHAIKQCPALQIKNLVAYIMEHNKPSIKLMEKFAFERWAFLPKIAMFEGKEFNHTIYGKRL